MNINNLSIVVMDCFTLTADERDKMYYKVFKNRKEVYDYIDEHKFETAPKNIELSFYNINEFLCELNADEVPLNEEWTIPVFIKDYIREVPTALMKNLSSEEQNTLKTQENSVKMNYVSMLDRVFQDAYDETIELIKSNGNCVAVGSTKYGVNENGELTRNGNLVIENSYGMCEIFDIIKQAIADKENLLHIADKILALNVDRITDIMQYIGGFGKYEEIREFNEIGKLIIDANDWGFDVKVELEHGRDYYVYGKIENDVYVIRGLIDERAEFEDVLNLDSWIEVIAYDKEYEEYLDKVYDEWKEEENKKQ